MKKILIFILAILIITSSFYGCETPDKNTETSGSAPVANPDDTPENDADSNGDGGVVDEGGNEDISVNVTPDEIISSADFANYESIIKMYAKIVEICGDYDDKKMADGVYDAMFDIPGETEREWYNAIFKSVYLFYPQSKDAFELSRISYGYSLKDLNGNGSDELILLMNDYTVLAVFSLSDGAPILLDNFGERKNCIIDGDGNVYVIGSSGAAYSSYSRHIVSDDGSELTLVWEIGTDGFDEDNKTVYYTLENGKKVRIPENVFDELKKYELGWMIESDGASIGLDFVRVKRLPRDISLEELSQKLGCYVSNKYSGDLDDFIYDDRISISYKNFSDVLDITVKHENGKYTNTVTLPSSFNYPDLYYGFTSDKNGYIFVFNETGHSVSAMPPIKLICLLKTADGGQTWNVIEYENPPGVNGRDYVEFAYFFNDQVGIFSGRYCVIENMCSRTWVTFDGGQSWRRIADLPFPDLSEALDIDYYATELKYIEYIDGYYVMTVRVCYGETIFFDGEHGLCIRFVSPDLKTWTLA